MSPIAFSSWRWWKRLVVLAGSFTFLGTAFNVAVVPTASMENTVLVGDHILVNRLLDGPGLPLVGWRLPELRGPRRSEIISFRPPSRPDLIFLKRVVAIHGDTVEIRDGTLLVNDRPVQEAYAIEAHRMAAMPRRVVPEGQLFVMGDNRDHSEDSRTWGTIPRETVIGRPVMVLWSCRSRSDQWLDSEGNLRLGFYWTAASHLLSGTRWSRLVTLL